MAKLKLMKKEWFNWFDKTFLDNITAWTEYYYINPDSQHWISNNLIDLSTFYSDGGASIDSYGNVTMDPTTAVQVVQFRCQKKKDDIVTISFDAYSDIDGSVVMADIYPDLASPTGDIRAALTTTKQHFRKTWTLEDNSSYIRFYRVPSHAYATESKVFISNISVVNGANEPVVYNPRLIKIEDILEVVDLGDLDWFSPNATGWTQSTYISTLRGYGTSDMPKIFCDKLTTRTPDQAYASDYSISAAGVAPNSRVTIRMPEFIGKSASEVKQILKGWYAVFVKNNSPY